MEGVESTQGDRKIYQQTKRPPKKDISSRFVGAAVWWHPTLLCNKNRDRSNNKKQNKQTKSPLVVPSLLCVCVCDSKNKRKSTLSTVVYKARVERSLASISKPSTGKHKKTLAVNKKKAIVELNRSL